MLASVRTRGGGRTTGVDVVVLFFSFSLFINSFTGVNSPLPVPVWEPTLKVVFGFLIGVNSPLPVPVWEPTWKVAIFSSSLSF